MATGAFRTNFADKRNMPQTRVKDTFFDYLLMRLEEIASRVWGGDRGIFGSTSLVSGGANRFSVSGPFPVYAIDGDGNIIELTTTYGTLVDFENELGITYSVGLRHTLIPSGVFRNPRTQVIHYDLDEDMIGELAEPDSVVELTGSLELEVDAITEVGVSNAGRSASVWLKRPRTTEEAVAIERNLTVVFSGGKNVLITTGLLGQGSPASTDPSDYQVALQGLTVKRNTDLSTVDPYAYIGTVTGGGVGNPPTGFGTAGQIDVSDGLHPDLQTAYAAGEVISPSPANGGAVRIESSTSGGRVRALLELDRKGAAEGAPQNLVLIPDRDEGVSILSLLPAQNLTDLQEDEPGTTAAVGVVDLTRAGVNVVGGGVDKDRHLVRMWDFTPTTGMNRFYRIASVTFNQVLLEELDGTPVATPWTTAETGNVGFYLVRLASGETAGLGGLPTARAPLTLTGQPGRGDDETLVRLFPQGATNSLEALDDVGDVIGQFTRAGILSLEAGKQTSDPFDALLRLRRYNSTGHGHIGLAAEMSRNGRAIPIVCLGAVSNGVELQGGEAVDVTANIVTFTRAGVDLEFEALRIRPDFHLVQIINTADPDDEKLYVVDSVIDGSNLTIKNFDGTGVSYSPESVGARVFVPRFAVADSDTPWGGTVLTGRDSYGNVAPILVYPEGGTLKVLDNGLAGAVNTPRDLIVIDPSKINSGQLDWPIKFLRSLLIRGGNVTGGPGEESFYTRDGLRVWNAGGYIDERDPAFALSVDYGFPEDIPAFHTWPVFGVDTLGGLARPHNFRDDFFGYKDNTDWTNIYPQPVVYKTYFVGAGYIRPRDVAWHQQYGHGSLYFQTSGSVSDVCQLSLNAAVPCNLDTDKDFRWTFRGRIKFHDELDCVVRFGFLNSTANERYYFQKDINGVISFVYWDGSAIVASPTTCFITDDFMWFQISLSPSGVFFAVESKEHTANRFMSGFESITSLAGNVEAVGPSCQIENQLIANVFGLTLDYWEIFDREVLYGRFGSSWAQQHP